MKALTFHLLLLALISSSQARAVEINEGGSISFNTNAPTSADIPDWNSGWGASGVTGWDYVGTVNGASAVYLGNNWVITAAHVGAGTFALGGTSYTVVSGSAQGVTRSNGDTVDLTLFQITQGPNLPALSISSTHSDPPQVGSAVAMIGYGGGQETWGLNTVTDTHYQLQISNYTSSDFLTDYGNSTVNGFSVSNFALLIGGDSGGGDFIYNTSTGTWMLSGINEAVDGNNDSYMVQLNQDAREINGVTAVPEPSSFGLLCIGIYALLWKFRMAPASRSRGNYNYLAAGRALAEARRLKAKQSESLAGRESLL